ncbi:hypothetical protein HDU83_004955 [Entophlyctis luteolus]|nr:hypothetical protein HDU83_004955 [Entophlyctis luteolus]
MSLDYLIAHYNYSSTLCDIPTSIDYYPTASFLACEGLAANSSQCTIYWGQTTVGSCVTSGFHENGLSAFTSSFNEFYIYSSSTCNDSSLTNLRQYRNNTCLQIASQDRSSIWSQRVYASTATGPLSVMIYNDTECTVLSETATFIPDNSTCQRTGFFNTGIYVKTSITTVSVATDSSASFSVLYIGIAFGSIIVLILLILFRRMSGVMRGFGKPRATTVSPANQVPLESIRPPSQPVPDDNGLPDDQLPAYSP